MIDSAITMCHRTKPAGWGTLLLFLAVTGVYVSGSVLVFEAGLLSPAISATMPGCASASTWMTATPMPPRA